jgi:hypothetical protein
LGQGGAGRGRFIFALWIIHTRKNRLTLIQSTCKIQYRLSTLKISRTHLYHTNTEEQLSHMFSSMCFPSWIVRKT